MLLAVIMGVLKYCEPKAPYFPPRGCTSDFGDGVVLGEQPREARSFMEFLCFFGLVAMILIFPGLGTCLHGSLSETAVPRKSLQPRTLRMLSN